MTAAPISLRMSVTDACSLRCRYCRAASEPSPPPRGTPLGTEALAAVMSALHRVAGIGKLRFTGGEPLLHRGVPSLVETAAKLGIPDISLTTNGQALAPLAMRLRGRGLRRVNVSLDSLDPRTYSYITRGGDLAACLRGIQAAVRAGLRPVKLNMVVMRGINDNEVVDLLEFGLASGCHVRFLELMPIGVAAAGFRDRFVPWLEVRDKLCERYRLEPLPYEGGATSRDYRAEDSQGRSTCCGFVSPTSRPFCKGCNRLRLTHDGRLLGCLARRDSLDVGPALSAARCGDTRPLAEAVTAALATKREARNLAEQRHMARIGG